MHFGEYELFPSLIGLSPLPTCVTKPSPWAWVDHLGFASTATDYTPCSDSLSLRLTRLKRLTSPVTSNS